MGITKQMMLEGLAVDELEERGVEPEAIDLLLKIASDLFKPLFVGEGMRLLADALDAHTATFVVTGVAEDGFKMVLVDKVARAIVWPRDAAEHMKVEDLLAEDGSVKYVPGTEGLFGWGRN